MNTFMNVMHTTTCNCTACAPVPTLDIKMPYEEEKEEPVKTRKGRQKLVVGENDLATVAPKAAAKDRFKFEAVHKAGYTMIRVQEPGLEVLDPKYDIVMPEEFYHHGKYDAESMEEVGRKVIHLLEEIYGRKASPEIWALNNFKEFEIWYDANKKELEANARKKGPKGKTAAKMAA